MAPKRSPLVSELLVHGVRCIVSLTYEIGHNASQLCETSLISAAMSPAILSCTPIRIVLFAKRISSAWSAFAFLPVRGLSLSAPWLICYFSGRALTFQ